MSKRHHTKPQTATETTNRMGHSMSIDPEAPPGMDLTPSYEDIQKRAYQIHERKGGSDLENWLEAERLLKEERRAGR